MKVETPRTSGVSTRYAGTEETTQMPQETRDLEYLETLIDQHGIRGVLLMLADLCSLKADHVQQNWNDDGLAVLWSRVGKRIGLVAHNDYVRDLSTAEGRKKDVRS